MPDQWMSIVEYARTFSISDMTIRRRIKSGKIHAVLREGKYYIPVKMTDGGKFIPQRKPSTIADNEGEDLGSSRETLAQQPLPRLIPRQIGISPNQNTIAQQSSWEHQSTSQRSRTNIEPSDQYKSTHQNRVLLTANGDSHQFQNTDAGAAPIPSQPRTYSYNNTSTQNSEQADPQLFSLLSHKIESMASLTRETLGRLDREKAHFLGEFEQRIKTQQEQLKNRDMEVQNLKQKLEDMQLLIKILEAKQSKVEI